MRDWSLRSIAIALSVSLIVILVLWFFKSLVIGSFESTDSLVFLVTAFFIAGMAVTLIKTFAPGSAAPFLINGVLVILGLFTLWSIMLSTSEVAAGSNKDAATGWYVKLASLLRPGTVYIDEVTHQADINCDEAVAVKKKAEEDKLEKTFKESDSIDVDTFIKEREKIKAKYSVAVLCKTSEVTAPAIPPPPASPPQTVSGRVHKVTVKSTVPWQATGINVTGKTVTIRRVSGYWNNVNDSHDQDGRGLGPYPGTIVSGAVIGELVGRTAGNTHVIGLNGTISNAKGELFLGMNDVPGKYGDNHGELVVEIVVQ